MAKMTRTHGKESRDTFEYDFTCGDFGVGEGTITEFSKDSPYYSNRSKYEAKFDLAVGPYGDGRKTFRTVSDAKRWLRHQAAKVRCSRARR